MSRIPEIGQQLQSLNRKTGDSFVVESESLAGLIPAEDMEAWALLVEKIAAGSWHAWEAAAAYINLSVSITIDNQDNLIPVGEVVVRLSNYTFEPAVNYLAIVERLMTQAAHRDSLNEVTFWLLERYPQASNLMSQYFRSTLHFVGTSVGDFKSFNQMVMLVGEHDRLIFDRFFSILKQSEHHISVLPWRGLMAGLLDQETVRADQLLVYLEQFPRFRSVWGEALSDSLTQRFLQYAGQPNVADWLEKLWVWTQERPDPEKMQRVLDYLSQIEDVDIAASLVEAASSGGLPLTNESVMTAWITNGLNGVPHKPALMAWFSLASARSQQSMSRLRGQVLLEDVQRSFQLFVEGLTGGKMLVVPLEDEYGLGLPFTDGRRIYLPQVVDRFSDNAANLVYLKVCLLHQLGYFEFGTFRLKKSGSRTPFADLFTEFSHPAIVNLVFDLVEATRIDHLLHKAYPGTRYLFEAVMADALEGRQIPSGHVPRLLEALLQASLVNPDEWSDSPPPVPLFITGQDSTILALMIDLLAVVTRLGSTVEDAARITGELYQLLEPLLGETSSVTLGSVDYRGHLNADQAGLMLQLAELEEEVNELLDGEDQMSITSVIDPSKVKIEELNKGEVKEAMAMFLTEIESMVAEGDVDEEELKEKMGDLQSLMEEGLKKPREAGRYYYDEWDYLIGDYRKNWCTLFEVREFEENPEYVSRALRDHAKLLSNVRRQLNMIRPEMLQKVKGVADGEELDLERAIEAIVDRRSGLTPGDEIYVQRQRKHRDVSALFLMDMSASTDDVMPDPDLAPEPEEPEEEVDDFLEVFYGKQPIVEIDQRKIIDLEKEAVVLMAAALEELGDNYAICGFSGYGRDQVEYYLCKDFSEPYNFRAKGRLGGIKPRRSTRMGPPIRHATQSLVATESRIKALIIISDGYPQDFDYGSDRSDKNYGLQDTARALAEARKQGVQCFCLTVDPSGHDYLKEMCPDQRYMVIQGLDQLPGELSKVYRSLTT